MNRSISIKAIRCDIEQILEHNLYVKKNIGLMLSIFFMLVIEDDFLGILVFGLSILIVVSCQLRNYLILKKKEKSKEIIFFKKKKNKQIRNLCTFLIMMFFSWLFRENIYWFLFNLGIGIFFLIQYIFFIPSIIFKVEDYSLLIERGFRRNRIDFTYTNKIRFVSNRVIFENFLDKKIEIKNVEYLSKMGELKEFLSDNFGREKVISAANGQPLI